MSSKEVQDLLPIPYQPSNYAKFDTKQILDDINVPKEQWGTNRTNF